LTIFYNIWHAVYWDNFSTTSIDLPISTT